jgi:HAE1 family hydrophobic/amphiphilic exporter-1
VVEFDFEKDLQEATQEIRDEISGIRNDLPPEMEEPVLTRFDPTDQPIVSLTVASDTLKAPELTRIADPGITRPLRSIPGVADVRVVGGVERELTVEIRPHDLQAKGISIAQLVQALQSQNLAAPVGRLTGALDERTIRLQGRLSSAQEFSQLVVTESAGRIVRLSEVATVRDGAEEPRSASMYNRKEAVGIDIVKSQGFSTTSVAEAVREELDAIRRRLPAGLTLDIVRDAGIRVEQSVANVREALLEGAALTVFVVFLFLNSWRSTVITGVALPVSVLAAFISVWAFGFTLNTMSLLGLSLAIGILIDDAIVVRENIVRHVEMGMDHRRAAIEGTNEIGLAVTATTLSIVVVFVPIAFMGGLAQQWFAPFALTIAASVLVSLFVSFSLDPMLSAYWPDPRKPLEERSWPGRMLGRFNVWFDRQAANYRQVIAWALDHRLAMLGLALLIFAISVAFPALGILGTAFLPVTDESEFNIVLETPPGSNLAYTRLKTEEIVQTTLERPEVRYTYSRIGGSAENVDEASIYVKLVPKSEREISQQDVAAALRRHFLRMAGITTSVGSGFRDRKQIQVQIQGDDTARLNELAERVMQLVADTPGAVDVGLSTRGQKPELQIEIDRALAGSLGITASDIANTLRPAFAGIDVGDWIDPSGETRDVMIRLEPESRVNTRHLESLPMTIAVPEGPASSVPLGHIARIFRGKGPARIEHLNTERVISVEANTQDRALSEVISAIGARLSELKLPAGYTITQGGEVENQQEVFGRMVTALLVAIMLMYFVLVVQFNSFMDPLAILVSLPLSFIGVVLGLALTGNTLNLMSLIGVILLMGIVAKNAILLIDFAKSSEESGQERRAAIIEAGRVRLRPIMMTTFALIAGMIPVALGRGEGADFRAPLGIAVIGGVITSTLLTLLVIPTVYETFADTRDWFRLRFRGRAETRPDRPSPAS